MQTLKFGGTSLANSKKFLHVSNIIIKKKKYTEVSVVLSAPAKITNYLSEIIENIKCKKSSNELLNHIKNIIYNIINDIKIFENKFDDRKILKNIKNIFQDIKNIIDIIPLYNKDKKYLYAKIISMGEKISIEIMQEILISKKYSVYVINPSNIIVAYGNPLNSIVDLKNSKKNFQQILIPKTHIILMPGFIAGDKNKTLVVLGRNGSDYSAAILAVCMNATICEIWTDVDGVYIADPKIIPHAKLLNSLSYKAAIELSYFGAKVLHPKTIIPLLENNIICKIKNTFSPEKSGTIIQKKENNNDKTIINGITHLENIVMIQIKILQLINYETIIKKIITIFYKKKIHIIFNHYSQLNNTNTFYIINNDSLNIQKIFTNTFNVNNNNSPIEIIQIKEKLKIISIIGKNISSNTTISKKILQATKYIDLNIIFIINTLSKNSIAIITDFENIQEIIKVIYNKLFNKQNILEIFLIGIGGVGKALIQQFQKQDTWLKNKNIQFKICGITNSKNMLINLNGIDLQNWYNQFKKSKELFSIQKIIEYGKKKYLFNPVIIDCTASHQITNFYSEILNNNINIVTPNKKANTSSWKKYQEIRKIAIASNKKFLYETNVSAGLPLITTLRNLFYSGDQLISFQGILSGSLSYIFGKLEENISLTQATKMAKEMGFTEPNPKDDLSGIDVARKLLIIAREAGYPLELKDIHIQPILPKELFNIHDEEKFFKYLQNFDMLFFEKIKQAKCNNKVLRYIGSIENKKCQVQLIEVDQNNPLYNVKNGENALTIYSNYYQPIPLVFRGYGAGHNVTAAGIFSDLLQILS